MTLYLNNSGHRWINVDKSGNREKIMVRNVTTGKVRPYAVKHWEAIGNFGVPYCQIQGKTRQMMEGRNEGEWVENNEQNRAWKYSR